MALLAPVPAVAEPPGSENGTPVLVEPPAQPTPETKPGRESVWFGPSRPEKLFDYGLLLLDYGAYEAAAKVFEQFVERFAPKSALSAAARVQLGRCRQFSGDLKGAWEAYHAVYLHHRKDFFWLAMAKVGKREVEQELAEQEALPQE
jgi:TolA-binding protein